MKGKRIIGIGTLILMIVVSVFIDILQFGLDWIPVIGWALNILVDGITAAIFWFWFKTKGVKFSSGGPLISFVGGALLDLVPFISAFAWTIDVLAVGMTARHPPTPQNQLQ